MSFDADRTALDHLIATGTAAEVDARLLELHTKHHDHPGNHVRVHLAWMRVHLQRGGMLRGLGHGFVGLVIAAPVSLIQRHTSLVVPAFDANRAR
jgi:hypothetical protein